MIVGSHGRDKSGPYNTGNKLPIVFMCEATWTRFIVYIVLIHQKPSSRNLLRDIVGTRFIASAVPIASVS